MAQRPITKRTLKTAEPTIAPKPTSFCATKTPMTLVASSGAEPPAAMKSDDKEGVAGDADTVEGIDDADHVEDQHRDVVGGIRRAPQRILEDNVRREQASIVVLTIGQPPMRPRRPHLNVQQRRPHLGRGVSISLSGSHAIAVVEFLPCCGVRDRRSCYLRLRASRTVLEVSLREVPGSQAPRSCGDGVQVARRARHEEATEHEEADGNGTHDERVATTL
eukprot:scaffold1954_cov268-Pinguiococcus_pyrenoidosus.AAC.108